MPKQHCRQLWLSVEVLPLRKANRQRSQHALHIKIFDKQVSDGLHFFKIDIHRLFVFLSAKFFNQPSFTYLSCPKIIRCRWVFLTCYLLHTVDKFLLFFHLFLHFLNFPLKVFTSKTLKIF